LVVTDARGRAVRSWLAVRGARVLLRVADTGARYPLVVDPYVQAAKLTASDGAAGDALGFSVAVSADGSTVVAGAPFATVGGNFTQGAVYVFTKSSTGWATETQTAKLTASDGAAFDTLGVSVAVSSDGSTVVAGAPGASYGGISMGGAVYVFARPSTGWANETQAAKLTASDFQFDTDNLGNSVGVSSDGSTVVAMTAGVNGIPSAVYVFTRPSTGWANETQAAELNASDGALFDELGFSQAVAVSADGSTVVAGGPVATVGTNGTQGAAFVFARPSTGWANEQQTAELTASDGAAGDNLGDSVGVSSDGSTVVAGAPVATVGTNTQQGAAYVFTEPSTGWANETQAATAPLTMGSASRWGCRRTARPWSPARTTRRSGPTGRGRRTCTRSPRRGGRPRRRRRSWAPQTARPAMSSAGRWGCRRAPRGWSPARPPCR
jgi:hypothetical protein